ncbi:hypothetical protein ATSB10_02500 [Dyella thiooxydans]|uniref:Uncharacterized protein n=1 Tax=Dyella thiooxydans TaxID=445710 RepID=A0A160MXJ9_9GAMM|nr:hypothetical protein ATSB10_02500 [Dyella thiooxydans]
MWHPDRRGGRYCGGVAGIALARRAASLPPLTPARDAPSGLAAGA